MILCLKEKYHEKYWALLNTMIALQNISSIQDITVFSKQNAQQGGHDTQLGWEEREYHENTRTKEDIG